MARYPTTPAQRDRIERSIYPAKPHDYEGRSLDLIMEQIRERSVERAIDRQLMDALHGQEMQRRIKRAGV